LRIKARAKTVDIIIWHAIHTGHITLSSNNSLYAIQRQKINPNAAMAKTIFLNLKIAETKMTIYPTRPIKGVGIPKVLATPPVIIASQFIVALIEHGLNAG
jgi:hypothetical protein